MPTRFAVLEDDPLFHVALVDFSPPFQAGVVFPNIPNLNWTWDVEFRDFIGDGTPDDIFVRAFHLAAPHPNEQAGNFIPGHMYLAGVSTDGTHAGTGT